MSNPYAAPDADISAPSEDGEYTPKLFSASGRIGRARYMAFSFVLMTLVFIPLAIIGGILGATMSTDAGAGALLLAVPFYIALFAISFIEARRRFHDLNQTSWLFVTLIIPFINILASLYLIFWPGTKGTNKYGLQPTKNDTFVWVVLGISVLLTIGIAAAIGMAGPEFLETLGEAGSAS